MKKIIIITAITAMLVTSYGCMNSSSSKEEEKYTNPLSKSSVQTSQMSVPADVDLKVAGKDPSNFFTQIGKMKGKSGSKAADEILEAVDSFNGIENDFKDIQDSGETVKAIQTVAQSIIPFGKNGGASEINKSLEIIKRVATVREDAKGGASVDNSVYQNRVIERVIPRFNNAITRLTNAIALNEEILLPKDQVGGWTAKITPAHILSVKGTLEILRGTLYFGCTYNITSTAEELKVINVPPTDRFIPKAGDYIFSKVNPSFMTIKNQDYVSKSYNDVLQGVRDLKTGIDNFPENEFAVFNEKYVVIKDDTKTFDFVNAKNALGIPKSLKSNLVKDIGQIEAALQNESVIKFNGIEVRLNLRKIFGMNMRETMKTVYNHISNSIDVNKQDVAGMATETFGGVLPEGLKVVMERANKGSWSNFTSNYKDLSVAKVLDFDVDLKNGKDFSKEDLEAIYQIKNQGKYKVTADNWGTLMVYSKEGIFKEEIDVNYYTKEYKEYNAGEYLVFKSYGSTFKVKAEKF